MSFGRKGLTGPTVDSAQRSDAMLPEREPRTHRLMKGTLFHERCGTTICVIRDISNGGIGGRCAAPLEPGDIVEIDGPCIGRLRAQIRWARNGQFGAQLTSDIKIDTREFQNLAFDNADWDNRVIKPLENHVFTRFRPIQNTYRPTLSLGARRDK